LVSKTGNDFLKIRDLVDVPEIRTVIQLEDLKDPDLRGMIAETFVLTSEVQRNLQAVLASLAASEGRGIFLKGHFGSGKSHFLGMLSLLLRYPRSWDTVLSQAPSLQELKEKLEPRRFFVVDLSLVQHRGSEFLEDILLHALFERLGEEVFGELDGPGTRHKTFTRLKGLMKERGFSGLVFLVDELSEFLRSKSDARAYNEDIRFLQYLGEEAVSFPMWVIASLQEWIEETGEIHQDTFNKIKDRYRIRLNLGRAHIEELVSERMIHHKEDGDRQIGEIYDDLKSFFPTFPVTRERFVLLYPVHPATSSLLDRLKPLFSEHRGVVDFIHFRLQGDPERHIPSLMDRPARRLLTPEAIFDHFIDRIRERAETQIYVQRVFDGYRSEIEQVFREPDQRQVALSAVKLMILFAISPTPYKYTVRHMAEMILFQITAMEAEINYQFLHDILDRLAKEGLYIRVENRDDPMDDHFYIDLKADMAGIMRQRIRHQAAQLFPEDRRLFWKTAPLAASPYLPLGTWVEKGRQQVNVRWQHTQRQGTLLLRQLDELTVDEIKGLSGQAKKSEEDFFILVGTTHNREAQHRHVKKDLLPVIRKDLRGTFLFWVPSGPEGETAWLREVLAAVLLQEGMKNGPPDKGDQGADVLRGFVERERKRLTEHFTHCYYHGVLLWDENEVDLSRFGYLTHEKFLSEFVPPLLDRHFSRHGRIQPYMDALAPGILKDMLSDFLFSGVLVVDDRSKFGIRDVLEGLLRPMGLVRKKGNQYELQVNPRQNELAQHLFKAMGERETVPLEEMYWDLRKSEYGLLKPHFEILVLAMIFSGHLVAYKVLHRKGPEELARTGLKGVTALGKGEIIGEELSRAIAGHPLVPRNLRNVPVTLASQEDLWAGIKSQKPTALEDLASLKSKIQWASSFEAFKNMPWEGLLKDVDDLTAQWDEVKVSLPSKEGLERFLRAGQKEPFLEKKLKAVHNARHFLEQAERALFVHQYITDQRLRIPDKGPYDWTISAPEGGIAEGGALEGYDLLREGKAEILSFYGEKREAVSAEALDALFRNFQAFQETYVRAYVAAHNRARGGAQFEPYEKLSRSRRYHILKRLDQLEMISVEHNHRSIHQALSSVLLHRCLRSPQDDLQGRPTCTCGFELGEEIVFKPLKEIELDIELGISETLEALHGPAVQEKILPYLKGLDLVNKTHEADAVRGLLRLEGKEEGFLDRLDQALTAQVIRHINEAFRGKVVVVKRDLDQLYRNLIHRKYTLAQLRKILREWLEEEAVGADTFLHFIGKGEGNSADDAKEDFRDFLEGQFGHLAALYREIGHTPFVKGVVTVFWAKPYGIPNEKMVEILPFLERGAEEESDRWIRHLRALAGDLCTGKGELFEALVSEAEEDPAWIQTLWSLLSALSPVEIFRKEAVFPLVLKEAFERVLCGKIAPSDIEELTGPPDSPASGVDSRFLRRRDDMVEALKTCRLFQEKQTALKALKPPLPETFSKWESFYIQTLSQLPALQGRLHDGLKRIGSPFPPFLKKEEREATGRLQEMMKGFAEFYGRELSGWEEGATPRPMMIQDIPSILSKKRNIPDHQRVCYLLMDGMRWDLWECIKTDFFGAMPNLFRFVREGAIWANQPTNTAPQIARFEEGLAATGRTLDADSFWKISGIDEKIHSEKGPLTHLFANVISYLKIDLLFRLRELPPRTLLILFADHGFVENPAFRPTEKYDASRYTHGKDSPFEVIVPWAWVMRI